MTAAATPTTGTPQYKIMPIILKNRIPLETKRNPRLLADILQLLKPEAKLKEIRVLANGDIQVVGVEPRDYNLLRQDWMPHDQYGPITPMLPHEKAVEQPVLILGIPVTISNQEIKDALFDMDLHPKKIERFNKKGLQEKSTTVMVTLSSMQQKARILESKSFNPSILQSCRL